MHEAHVGSAWCTLGCRIIPRPVLLWKMLIDTMFCVIFVLCLACIANTCTTDQYSRFFQTPPARQHGQTVELQCKHRTVQPLTALCFLGSNLCTPFLLQVLSLDDAETMAPMTVGYHLQGLEASATGGLHIHSGTSCQDTASQGGHYYRYHHCVYCSQEDDHHYYM